MKEIIILFFLVSFSFGITPEEDKLVNHIYSEYDKLNPETKPKYSYVSKIKDTTISYKIYVKGIYSKWIVQSVSSNKREDEEYFFINHKLKYISTKQTYIEDDGKDEESPYGVSYLLRGDNEIFYYTSFGHGGMEKDGWSEYDILKVFNKRLRDIKKLIKK